MEPVKYYQIGGFKAHLPWAQWNPHSNSEVLIDSLMRMFRDDDDLVLGIRPNGASYLLLPVDQFDARFGQQRPRDRPWNAHDFESLSPIQFGTEKALIDKLASYVSNKKTRGGDPRDRSKANTEYTSGGEALSDRGEERSCFEHQRLLYRLLQKTIRRHKDFAVSLPPWFHDIQIYSLAFNLWFADTRPLDERLANPRVLDVGWTEFDAPTDSDDLKAVSTTHLTVEEERYLGNPGKTRLTLPDITQAMPRDSIATLLQNVFSSQQSNAASMPKLLLVHDTKTTMAVLHAFGVDTSKWATGIKQLLYSYSSAARNDLRTVSQYDVHLERRDRGSYGKPSRGRSRSPRRQSTDERHVRQRSPPTHRAEAPPVYIVDVRAMYGFLMRVAPGHDNSILLNAKALHLRDTALHRGEDDQVIYQDIDPKQWCAGKESRLIGYMWEDLANGVAIDEQRAYRNEIAKEAAALPPAARYQGRADDDDVDPNDIMQPMGAGSGQPKPSKPYGMFDSEDEDDEYY
ncbi:hypothetical protein GSI_14064 [Ganoderma sinense ZZ0214-1]|uniref:Uncharacterized protein n=1 Tax=Ganoderma sinense ZZ0214-1 TaxID=1077348 RepID=A0A2G8RS44_9APHY|nr:hypothetical protein GSI_14064 [Ganoderma sinense ZZ0214-1]